MVKYGRVFLVLVKYSRSIIPTPLDILQEVNIFVTWIYNVNAASLGASVSITSTCCLCDGVEPCQESDNDSKIDIDAGLDKLGADTHKRFLGLKAYTDFAQLFPAVCCTHTGAEMINR